MAYSCLVNTDFPLILTSTENVKVSFDLHYLVKMAVNC